MGLETEADDLLGVGLVHGSELLTELSPRDVGSVGVEDVKDLSLRGEKAKRGGG